MMDTFCSLIVRVISESRPWRSRASICTVTVKTAPEESLAHSTSMRRSGSSLSFAAFVQSVRWTLTPPPRVTKPKISSPGTGVQHLASLAIMSAEPATRTPAPSARRRFSGACSFDSGVRAAS